MVIVSPELELLMAVCIEFPGWTIISAADPIPEINTKIRKIPSKMISLFLISIPPSIKKVGVKSASGAKFVLLVIHENCTQCATNVQM